MVWINKPYVRTGRPRQERCPELEEAREKGLKTYFTGRPCANGHVTERYTLGSICLGCNRHKAQLIKSNGYYRAKAEKMNRMFDEFGSKYVPRAEAKEKGLPTYFQGTPCPKGHIAHRYVSSMGCIECARDLPLRRNKKLRTKERKAGRPKPNACEVCRAEGKIVWDHCHRSEKFRGWICEACNVILGRVKDDAPRLRALAQYLEGHEIR